MKESTIHKLFFTQPKPTISFLQSGTVLPSSNNLKINFSATNLRAIDVTIYKIYKDNMLQFLQSNRLSNTYGIRFVGRPIAKNTVNLQGKVSSLDKSNAFAIDLAELINPEAGAMYRVELDYNLEYSNYQCDGKVNKSNIIFGKKESEHWGPLFGLLNAFNQSWACDAAVLVLIISNTVFEHNGKSSVTHSFDAGAAWENLALEGSARNLVVHGMQGFDYKNAKTVCNVELI